jgi:cytochrome bd-type quinol oxidase subunit 1
MSAAEGVDYATTREASLVSVRAMVVRHAVIAIVSAVGTTWLVISLAVFITLYVILGVLDIWLMRRYAGRDPRSPAGEPAETPATPAVGY